MPSFPMADGAEAEYTEGNYHVIYQGVTYLNCSSESLEPVVFTDDTKGELNEKGGIGVNGGFKRSYVLHPAQTISIKLEDGSVAQYLEGALELNYNGEKYLLMGRQPLFSMRFRKFEAEGTIDGTSLNVHYLVGIRGRCVTKFEKEGDESSKKRKRLDLKGQETYTSSKKLVQVKDKMAPQVLELAKKARESVKELIALEKEARTQAGVKREQIFEHEHNPFEDALAALSQTVRIAQGGIDDTE